MTLTKIEQFQLFGLFGLISASYTIGAFGPYIGLIFEVPICAGIGIFVCYYYNRVKTDYGNDLFLKTLTKAKQEGITITVTNATCPHCGGNIFKEPLP